MYQVAYTCSTSLLLLPDRRLLYVAALIARVQAAQQQLALQLDIFTLFLVTILQQNRKPKK